MATETFAAPAAGLFALLHDEEEDLGWQERALCAQTDPESFFPEKGGSTWEAKRVCGSCEVRADCLGYALEHDERFGIWGGLSERERRRLRRQDGSGPRPAPARLEPDGRAQPPARGSESQRDPAAPDSPSTGPAEAPPGPPAPPAQAPDDELVRICQRRDLSPVDRAEAVGALQDRGLTPVQVAELTGLSPSTLSFYQVLLTMDTASRERVRAKELSATAAVRAIRRARAGLLQKVS